ncbi:leucine-rich repeat domain-containing protein [Shewanella sp. MEBiC00475]|uniref:leucine-rich repeat domain-containing protein n=1 Tax=Shewanella sp. MEBiC00475 TaxID=2575361 RepID=UPI0010BF8EA0|nr:leucine-rich repeat domain-containing protein [Shewanella sp. MEBiC00475]
MIKLFVAVFLFLFLLPAHASTALWHVSPSNQMQTESARVKQQSLSRIQQLYYQGEVVTFNRASLANVSSGDKILLPIDSQSYSATLSKVEIHPNGSKTWHAIIDDAGEPLPVIITFSDKSFFARAVTPSGTYVASGSKISGRLLKEAVLDDVIDKDKKDFLRPQDSEEFKRQQAIKKQIEAQVQQNKTSNSSEIKPALSEAHLQQLGDVELKQVSKSTIIQSDDQTMAEIDVLILYTPGVNTLYSDDPLTRIYHLISVTNQIYVDSGVFIHTNAVAIEEVDYSDNVYSDIALNDISFQNNTVFDDIPSRRYELGADMVILLRPYVDGDYACGIAWANGSNGSVSNSRDLMYSHTSIDCGDYVMAHELGHNMGLMHSRRQEGEGATFPFGLGYGLDGNFTTVMAYEGVFAAGKVYKFSSPNLDCNGLPCGIDRDDPLNGADAVYALNAVRFELEEFFHSTPDLTTIDTALELISDNRLKNCITQNLNYYNGIPKYAGMLEEVYCGYWGITSLSGLEYFYNVFFLDLSGNYITRIRELEGMQALRILDLSNIGFSDLSGIESLEKLENVNLSNNQINNISMLAAKPFLEVLRINNNRIADIDVLSGLGALSYLDASTNLISDLSGISQNTSLTDLYINNNQIKSVPVNINTLELGVFSARNNQISDISGLANLRSLGVISLDYNNLLDITPIFTIQDSVNGLSLIGNELIPCWQVNYAAQRFGVAWLPTYCDESHENEDYDGDGLANAVEVEYGLDPSNPLDAEFDNDNDGLNNAVEITLGTEVNNPDSDGDGVVDGTEVVNGSDPFNKYIQVGSLSTSALFSDVNQDGVADWIKYTTHSNRVEVTLLSGNRYNALANYVIDNSFENPSTILLDDRDADGINEVGVFGFDASVNRYQLQVHSGLTGTKLDVWNWPATLGEVKFQALTDLTGDGIQEYAISGVHLVNGTQQLVVKDGVSKSTYQTFKWPNLWDKSQFVIMSDVTFDGVPEVALYGRHSRLDKGQLFVYDGVNANSKIDVYNWNKLWSDIQLLEMDDIDGDGTIDWGQFGQRKDDGRYQWVVKKGSDKRGVIRVFSWPNDVVDVTPMLVADRTGDGIRDVAVLGTSPDNEKVFVRINDGRLANQRIANISWPASWEDIQVKELGDLNNDGFSEFGLLGYTKTNRTVQLIVRDGQTTAEYGRYTLSGQWEGLSLAHYDIDNDGSDDVVISGINQTTRAKVLTGLSGGDLAVVVSQSLN